jgi:hypothetical protein
MPPPSEYSTPLANFFRYVWDVRGIPLEQDMGDHVIITPQLGRLVIYGRMIKSKYAEDWPVEAMERERGRIMGEWYSTACVDGEPGFVWLNICDQISAEEFSAAYQRGWKEE